MRSIILNSLTALVLVVSYPLTALAQSNQLDGVWFPSNSNQGPVSSWSLDELPFTPAGLAAFNGNLPSGGETRRLAAFQNDPIADANPPGLYRSFVYSRPWEFIQFPDRVVQIFEWTNHWRVIFTDGREVPEQVVTGPFWYGYSVGQWEGDTLVVQTVDLDGRAWMDARGTPISEYSAKVEERWTRTGDDSIELTITVNDPEFYSRPWTSDVKTFAFQPKGSRYGEMEQVIFAPIDEIEFNSTIVEPSATGPIPLD